MHYISSLAKQHKSFVLKKLKLDQLIQKVQKNNWFKNWTSKFLMNARRVCSSHRRLKYIEHKSSEAILRHFMKLPQFA